MRRRTPLFIVVLLLASAPVRPAAAARRGPSAAPSPPSAAVARATLARFATSFVENRGQAHPSVLFYGGRPGRQVSLTKRGIVVALAAGDAPGAGERVAIEFVGADPGVRPVGRIRTAAANVFRG